MGRGGSSLAFRNPCPPNSTKNLCARKMRLIIMQVRTNMTPVQSHQRRLLMYSRNWELRTLKGEGGVGGEGLGASEAGGWKFIVGKFE